MAAILREHQPRSILVTSEATPELWEYTSDLVTGFASRGIDVTLALLGAPPSPSQLRILEILPNVRIEVTRLPSVVSAESATDLSQATSTLLAAANEFAVDLVHLHSPMLAGTKRWTMPVVASNFSCSGTWWSTKSTGQMPADLMWRTRATAIGMSILDCVIAPTWAHACAVTDFYGAGLSLVSVPIGRRPSLKINPSAEKFVFSAGDIWHEGWNASTMDKIAGSLTVPMYCSGEPRSLSGSTVQLKNLRCLGQIDSQNKDVVLGQASVFISAATYDPVGIHVLDAARAGAALVLSDLPGYREFWEGAAVFVNPRNADDFVGAAESLLGNSQWRAEMALNALDRSREYGTERMLQGLLHVYAAVLAKRAIALTA